MSKLVVMGVDVMVAEVACSFARCGAQGMVRNLGAWTRSRCHVSRRQLHPSECSDCCAYVGQRTKFSMYVYAFRSQHNLLCDDQQFNRTSSNDALARLISTSMHKLNVSDETLMHAIVLINLANKPKNE